MTKQFYEEAITRYDSTAEKAADMETLIEHSKALSVLVSTEKGCVDISTFSDEFKRGLEGLLLKEVELMQYMKAKATAARKYDEEHGRLGDGDGNGNGVSAA